MPVNAAGQGGTNFYALKNNPRRAIKRNNQRGRFGLKMRGAEGANLRVHSAFGQDVLMSRSPTR